MDYSDYQTILAARRGRVLTLTLNRPEALNAVDPVMHAELARIFGDVAADADCDIVVLTGAGAAFSAGGDIDWMQAMVDDPAQFERTAVEAKQIVFGLLDLEKPIIARVNGPAVGLGATSALFCDIVVAAEDATIADPHVRMGLVAGDGGAVIWPQLIGYARAKEFLMTGQSLDGRRAAELGLINHAVPAAELDAKVDAIAERLAGGATQAIRWTKTAVNIGLKQLAHSIMDASIAYEMASNRTADHREAVAAFREKRKPKFTGA
jgi:enoyl-CoA hydratase